MDKQILSNKLTPTDNRRIIISKNYGIIEFKETSSRVYNLVGIEGENRQLGEQLPNFWDFFDYEVGDIFQERTSGGENMYYSERTTKYEIISKNVNFDTITYEISGIYKNIFEDEWGYPTITVSNFEDEIKYISSEHELINRFPNELICLEDYTMNWDKYQSVQVRKEDGLYVIETGATNQYDTPIYVEVTAGEDLLENKNDEGYIALNYKESLGFSFVENLWLAWGDKIVMGKVHNGDTIGTVYPDDFFTEIKEFQPETEISIFPNPVEKGQNINLSDKSQLSDKFEYTIYNFAGQKITTGNPKNNQIPTSNLNAGLYILEVSTNKNVVRKKFIVK